MNGKSVLRVCCCRTVCRSCEDKIGLEACPLCRLPCAENPAESLARLRRHVENELPEAISFLGDAYRDGNVLFRIVMNKKKAANRVQRQACVLRDNSLGNPRNSTLSLFVGRKALQKGRGTWRRVCYGQSGDVVLQRRGS